MGRKRQMEGERREREGNKEPGGGRVTEDKKERGRRKRGREGRKEEEESVSGNENIDRC